LSRFLLSQLRTCQFPQFIVDEWQQLLGCARITLFDLREYLSNFDMKPEYQLKMGDSISQHRERVSRKIGMRAKALPNGLAIVY
jgi:hypothetical protein